MSVKSVNTQVYVCWCDISRPEKVKVTNGSVDLIVLNWLFMYISDTESVFIPLTFDCKENKV